MKACQSGQNLQETSEDTAKGKKNQYDIDSWEDGPPKHVDDATNDGMDDINEEVGGVAGGVPGTMPQGPAEAPTSAPETAVGVAQKIMQWFNEHF